VTVRIRPYRPSDRDVLHRCFVELRDRETRADPGVLSGRTPRSDRRYTSLMMRRYREHRGFVLVAEMEGVPAGFVAGWVHRYSGSDTYSRLERLLHRSDRRGHVSELLVLERFRRKGLGTRLLRAAEERFRKGGCDVIELDVDGRNWRARRLYRHAGYVPRSLGLAKRLRRAGSRAASAS